ncbi:MAG: glycosyltransferase [Saprospiraceae bacterium]|nr:glycosyltransferase [Saprospiraceae bacterium]
MKILHVLDGFGIGGAEVWLVELARFSFLNSDSLSHDFLCTGGEERYFDQELKKLGCTIFYFKYSTKHIFKFRSYCVSVLKDTNYDMILDHTDYGAGWHFLALYKFSMLKVAYLHNPLNQTWHYKSNLTRKLTYKIGRWLMAFLSDKLTGTSEQVMNEYGYDRWPYLRIRIKSIHCAFDINKFTFSNLSRRKIRDEFKTKPGQILILFIGRLRLEVDNPYANQKNPLFALDLAKKLSMSSDKYHFLFVGDKGHSGLEMEKNIAEMDLSNKIYFTGPRKDIPALMSGADILLFPSLFEGLGMVAVEAQANQLPVIMSDRVPIEAMVDSQLVKILPLTERLWLDAIHKFAPAIRSEEINHMIKDSDFNITRCNENLKALLA